ncbi:MAG TPA: hypothetical protein VK712_02470 [Verrucomicrobiae bacterium]|jgi:hypothetical protein|nr:hypothetical protein [Verrucomicrobiae bacterium]
MKTLEAPSVTGFEPTTAYQVLGVDYLRLASDDRVTLDLTEAGVQAIDQNPAIASLIERMGVFIAEHDGYHNVPAVRAAEPCDVLRVGSQEPDYHFAYHYSSVYHPVAVPEALVKAFDFDPSGTMQFNIGAWMHDRLAASEHSISSPQQLAMFTAPRSRHRTTVAAYVPGTTVFNAHWQISQNYGPEIAGDGITTMHVRAEEQLRSVCGRLGRLMMNDLENSKNLLLVDDVSALTADEILSADCNLAVIDQPKKTLRALSVHKLIRLSSRLKPELPSRRPSAVASLAS